MTYSFLQHIRSVYEHSDAKKQQWTFFILTSSFNLWISKEAQFPLKQCMLWLRHEYPTLFFSIWNSSPLTQSELRHLGSGARFCRAFQLDSMLQIGAANPPCGIDESGNNIWISLPILTPYARWFKFRECAACTIIFIARQIEITKFIFGGSHRNVFTTETPTKNTFDPTLNSLRDFQKLMSMTC